MAIAARCARSLAKAKVGIGVATAGFGHGEREGSEEFAGHDQRHANIGLQAQRTNQPQVLLVLRPCTSISSVISLTICGLPVRKTATMPPGDLEIGRIVPHQFVRQAESFRHLGGRPPAAASSRRRPPCPRQTNRRSTALPSSPLSARCFRNRQRRQNGARLGQIASRLLCLFVVLNVGAGAEPFYDLSVLVPDWNPTCFEPTVMPIMSADTVFQVIYTFIFDGRHPTGHCPCPVVRMDDPVQPSQAKQLTNGNARIDSPLAAQVIALTIRQISPHQIRNASARLRQRRSFSSATRRAIASSAR